MIIRDPCGVYKVGSSVFINKTEAIYRANLDKLPMTWDFHEDVYSKFDWTKRPPGTIHDYYRERAQQLRDTYDHIAILFSGGMDSWTVLNSFLSNNIHVDEIITNWPFKAVKYHKVNNVDYREGNLFSEFKFSVMPVLEHVKKNFPRTTITIDDYSDLLETDYTEEKTQISNSWQFMSSIARIQGRSSACDEAVKHNKSVARIVGAEKTRISVSDNKLYSYFMDLYPSGQTANGVSLECFYHSVDAPLIPIIQAHYLRDTILKRQITGVEDLANIAYGGRTKYDFLYAEACYPDYPIDTFQVGKTTGTHLRDSDNWIAKHNPRYYKGWKWAYDQYFAGLDDSLVKKDDAGTITGLLAYKSGMYLVDPNFGSSMGEFSWNRI